MARFQGKVVIVTGSSSGIGRATAVLFAKEGANLTICGRKVDALKETAEAMKAAGASPSQIHTEVGDITSDEVQKKTVENTVAKWGKLDILVNNAGASFNDPTEKQGFEASMEIFQKTMDINLVSVLKMINVATPHLKETKGDIVNVSTICALNFAFEQGPYYAIAKAGLDQMSRAMSTTLAPFGIRVNTVNPGLVKTNFMNNMGLPTEVSDKIYNYFDGLAEAIPLRRYGFPEDIATVIAFLANKKESGFILGQNIVADGGSAIVQTTGAHLNKALMS